MQTIRRLCTLVLLAACSQATSPRIEARVGESVDLTLGQVARVQNSSVTVRFSGVDDSRCPLEVLCVTAGDAVITLLLSGAGSERWEVVHRVREPKAATYGGYRFEASALAPYPSTNAPGVPKTLTLRITQAP
jgi:hypothetical protein